MPVQRKRLLSQISLFVAANLGAVGIKTGFCYPFLYCQACPAADAACPLRALEQGVFRGSITWRLLVYPLMILGAIGIATGRAVCGWACPIGLLQRGTGNVARKVKQKPIAKKLGSTKFEKYFRYNKYVMLVVFVFLTSMLIGFIFTDVCPVGVLVGTIPIMILNPGKFVPNYFFPIAIAIFGLFIVMIFTVERGWCRYFCPVGALLGPMNKVSMLHMEVKTDGCSHCNLCSKSCPMGIDVPNMHRSPECILCGKCVDACPHKFIQYKVKA
jgi:ferredoxin-type protein NapH